MTSRYGRNQRRAARDRIAALELQQARLAAELTQARHLVRSAREDGASDLLKVEYLAQAVEQITQELARAFGPKIADAAKKLIASDRRREPIKFSAYADVGRGPEITMIEGTIPALHYRVPTASF